MSNITCPHCQEIFKMDATDYASIVQQVRGTEFESELHKRLADVEEKHQLAIKLAETKAAEEKDQEYANKDKKIQRLKGDLEKKEREQQLALSNATTPLQTKISELKNRVENAGTEKSLLEKTLNERHKVELEGRDQIIKMKDDEIQLRKDMKMKLNTKMLGETLEQHCEIQF